MNTKKTLTIGIPVYNEAQNIEMLLKSIFKQRCISYKLQRILIISDGSYDQTVDIVKIWQRRHPEISIKVYSKRLGKAVRLNEIYEANKSDYLFTLDGDVVLGTSMEIEKVLAKTEKNNAKVVAAHQIPCKVHGFMQRISYANHCLWTEVRTSINGGDYIENLQGSATLISREFAKQVH